MKETKKELQYNHKIILIATILVTENKSYNKIIKETAKDKKIQKKICEKRLKEQNKLALLEEFILD